MAMKVLIVLIFLASCSSAFYVFGCTTVLHSNKPSRASLPIGPGGNTAAHKPSFHRGSCKHNYADFNEEFEERTLAGTSGVNEKAVVTLPKIKSLFDRVFYRWVQDLMERGNAKYAAHLTNASSTNVLEIEDLWSLREDQKIKNLSETFEREFQEETKLYVQRQVSSPDSTTVRTAKEKSVLVEFWSSPLTKAIVKM